VVRDPQQHGGALLEGVGMPARPQEEQPKVKAQGHVVRRSSNGRLEAFE
jgi:hypothetical protein